MEGGCCFEIGRGQSSVYHIVFLTFANRVHMQIKAKKLDVLKREFPHKRFKSEMVAFMNQELQNPDDDSVGLVSPQISSECESIQLIDEVFPSAYRTQHSICWKGAGCCSISRGRSQCQRISRGSTTKLRGCWCRARGR
jgi:hypothetical protein